MVTADQRNMTVCPDCKGRKRLPYPKGEPPTTECGRCKGEGVIDLAMERWIEIGRAHQDWRWRQQRVSLAEWAQRMGITVPELAAMERGTTDSTALIEQIPRILRKKQWSAP